MESVKKKRIVNRRTRERWQQLTKSVYNTSQASARDLARHSSKVADTLCDQVSDQVRNLKLLPSKIKKIKSAVRKSLVDVVNGGNDFDARSLSGYGHDDSNNNDFKIYDDGEDVGDFWGSDFSDESYTDDDDEESLYDTPSHLGISSFQTLDSVPNFDDRLSSLTNSYSSPSPLNSLQSSSDRSSDNSVKLSPKLSNYSTSSQSTGCLTNGSLSKFSCSKSSNRETIYARPTVSPPPPPIKTASTTYAAAQFARQQFLRHYASSPCANSATRPTQPTFSHHQKQIQQADNVYQQPKLNSLKRTDGKDETEFSEAKSESVKSMTSANNNTSTSTINTGCSTGGASTAYASSTLKRVIRRPAGSPPPPPLPRSAPPPLDDNESSSGTDTEAEQQQQQLEVETSVDDVDNQQPSLSSNEDNTINDVVTNDHDSHINRKTGLTQNNLDTIYHKTSYVRQNDLNNVTSNQPCPPVEDYNNDTNDSSYSNNHCNQKNSNNNHVNSLEDEEDYCVPIECDGSATIKKSGGGLGATAPRPTWLKPSLDRTEAERLLTGATDGKFLVRVARRAGAAFPYSLSVAYGGRVFHLPIRHTNGLDGDQYYSLGKGTSTSRSNRSFESLAALVDFYTKNSLLLVTCNRGRSTTGGASGHSSSSSNADRGRHALILRRD